MLKESNTLEFLAWHFTASALMLADFMASWEPGAAYSSYDPTWWMVGPATVVWAYTGTELFLPKGE